MKQRTAYHHGDLYAELVKEGAALIGEKGLESFTLRSLARRVGVSHTACYRHFQDRDAVLLAIRRDGFTRMAERMVDRTEDVEDPLLRFRMLGRAYVGFASENPSVFRVMFLGGRRMEAHNPNDPAQRTFKMLRDAIVASKNAKLLSDASVESIALAAWSLVHGVASLVVDGQLPADPEKLRPLMFPAEQVFFDGALARK